MKKIKLSNKLFIGLTILILALLIWQACFTKSEIERQETLRELTSAGQLMELIKNDSDYKQIPLSDIKAINFTDNIPIVMMKGEKNAIFMHKYCQYKPNKTFLKGNNITLNHKGPSLEDMRSIDPIIIILKTEPEKISMTSDSYSSFVLLTGFNGKNTEIENQARNLSLNTDMKEIHFTNHSSGRLDIDTYGFNNSGSRASERKINIDGEVNHFYLNDLSDTLSLNINLNYGNFSIELAENTYLKELNIQGSLYQDIKEKRLYQSTIHASGLSLGDAIHFNFVCPEEGNKHILRLPEEWLKKQDSFFICDRIEIMSSEL